MYRQKPNFIFNIEDCALLRFLTLLHSLHVQLFSTLLAVCYILTPSPTQHSAHTMRLTAAEYIEQGSVRAVRAGLLSKAYRKMQRLLD